jgi:RsiW-degrading membrane proteinase PrsW (M82 family)
MEQVMVAPARRTRSWLRIFLIGLGLWLAAVVVLFATGNPNLVPTVVLLGSFLVPVSFVAWAFGRRDTGEVDAGLIFSTFLTGGVLGTLGAAVLEQYLLRPSAWLFFGVGLIEEAVKLAALALLTRHLEHKSLRDGMILGATVGFGFAAFESAGYAFTALFTANGLSLTQLVQTEILRGVLAPVGHGLWTAILGGILFAASTRRHFTVGVRLVVAYLGVSVLHALWDSMHTIAVLVTLVATEGEAYRQGPTGWLVQPTAEQVRLLPIVEWTGLGVVAAIGIVWLALEWRAGRRGTTMRGWKIAVGRPAAQ